MINSNLRRNSWIFSLLPVFLGRRWFNPPPSSGLVAPQCFFPSGSCLPLTRGAAGHGRRKWGGGAALAPKSVTTEVCTLGLFFELTWKNYSIILDLQALLAHGLPWSHRLAVTQQLLKPLPWHASYFVEQDGRNPSQCALPSPAPSQNA